MLEKIRTADKYKITLAASGVLFMYVLLRAWLMSFTRDESYTWLEYVRHGHFFAPVYNDMSANNHLLNTWLMILFDRLLGTSELALRLPNVLSFILYLFYARQFALVPDNKWVSIASFAVLTLNPYLVDFFSVGRGYGLSLAFLLGSLYHLYRYIGDRGIRSLFAALICGCLMVLANFTFLNCLIFLGACAFFMVVADKAMPRSEKLKHTGLMLLIATALAALIVPVIISLKGGGSFSVQHFGAPEGIWGDTFKTLIGKSLYEKMNSDWVPVAIMVLILLFTAWAIRIFSISKKKDSADINFLRFIVFALFFFVAFIYLLYYGAGAQFPRDRIGLFFLPFLALLVVFILQTTRLMDKYRVLLSGAVIVALTVHFVRAANFKYALEYKADADIRKAVMLISEDADPEEKDSVSIGVHYAFFGPFNFYKEMLGLTNWRSTGHDELFSRVHDYYFVVPGSLAELDTRNLETMKEFRKTGTLLLRNLKPNESMNELYSERLDIETCNKKEQLTTNYVYQGKYSLRLDSTWQHSGISTLLTDSVLNAGNVVFRFGAMLFSEDTEAKAHLVVSYLRKDSTLSWQNADLYYLIPKKQWKYFSFSAPVPREARAGDEVRAYVWNNGKIEVYVDALSLVAIKLPF